MTTDDFSGQVDKVTAARKAMTVEQRGRFDQYARNRLDPGVVVGSLPNDLATILKTHNVNLSAAPGFPDSGPEAVYFLTAGTHGAALVILANELKGDDTDS